MDDVVWKDIKGYERMYQISNRGEVKSFKYNNPRILKPRVNSGGYMYVNLCKDKKSTSKYIHRLVAKAFLQGWDRARDVDHIDMDRLNNHVENLRMASRSQNHRNSVSQKGSSSKYKNVYWNKQNSKWRVMIWINGKNKHIGYFTNEEEAGRVADESAKTFFSEEDLKYHRFNFPYSHSTLSTPFT